MEEEDGGDTWPRVTEGSPMERDLRLAAVTDLPVLISGTPRASREIASRLDGHTGAARRTVEVVDCRQEGALCALTRLTAVVPDAETARGRILLLQEVHALTMTDQILLEREIERMRLGPNPVVRILASSSVELFERVVDHLFSERLYYRLNIIHVVVPPEG
jgi:transcriptional regulator of acetoin/glycerol metabolism